MIAVPVDPYVIQCQWDLAAEDLARAKKNLAIANDDFWPALQFFDVTSDGTRGSPSFSVDVHLSAGNWFVRCCSPEHMYRADLVIRNEDGSFAVVASSNSVRTPPASTSEDVDLDWMPIRLPPTEPKIGMAAPVSAQSVQSVRIDLVKEVPSGAPVPQAAMQPESSARATELPSNTERRNQATEPSQLHREKREIAPTGPAGPLLPRPATRERLPEVGFAKPRTFETKADKARDLTELNESSFLSGISSTRN